MEIPAPELFYELLPVRYISRISRRGVKIRGLWYDGPALEDYRGTTSTRGGRHKNQWVIRRDPRDRRQVFFQDPVTHAWHALDWTGLPPVVQMPAFGDARVRDLLKKATACGLKPKSDIELLPVLLELTGSKIPVSQWPAQMTKTQRTDHAREVTQASAAQAGRPAPGGDAAPVAPATEGPPNVTALHWPQRARQTIDSIDAERRRRREVAVPVTPKPPPPLGTSFRERNVFVLPGDEQDRGPAGHG